MKPKHPLCFMLINLLVGLVFLSACGRPVSELEPTAVPETSETVAAEGSSPPVTLIAPLPDASFDGVSVTLEWSWIRKLNPNEKYDVRVWREGEPELGITLISQTYLDLNNWLVHQTPGTYNWRVYVVQTEGDRQVRLLTPASEVRQFSVANVDDPVAALTLPEGFQASLITSVPNPTTMAMDEAGTLYIANLSGDILAQTAAQRGTAEANSLIQFASGFDTITGLMVYEDQVYVSSNGRVTVLADADGDHISDESRELFEPEALPGRQYDSHSNNGMAIGPDGQLYLLVGSTSDHGPEENPMAGVVLRYDLETGAFDVFARGLRNPYDLAFDAEGNLYAGDNGPDAPDATLLSIPPDEINLIEAGKHYGYPDYFGIPPAGSGTEAPVIQLPASSAITGLIIYDGQNFPAGYQGAIFTALWGSGVISHPTGHRVSVITRSPEGIYLQENLADFLRGVRRPIEVIQTNEGKLVVADFETGFIFEIEYVGS